MMGQPGMNFASSGGFKKNVDLKFRCSQNTIMTQFRPQDKQLKKAVFGDFLLRFFKVMLYRRQWRIRKNSVNQPKKVKLKGPFGSPTKIN